MFMYSYCYVCSVLGILFHCVVLCIVCVWIYAVLLPPAVNPIAVNKYINTIQATLEHEVTARQQNLTIHNNANDITDLQIVGKSNTFQITKWSTYGIVNHLNAELNPICHLLSLLVHHILHVSRIRVKDNSTFGCYGYVLARRSAVRTSVTARDFVLHTPVQTDHGAHLSSSTMITGALARE